MNSHRTAAGTGLRRVAWVAAFSALLGGATADSLAAGTWLTGVRLQRRLALPVDVVWAENPLRRALGSLSQAHEVAVLIDRRVDPGQEVELSLASVSLEIALKTIAENQNLGMSLFGAVAYFGPPKVAARLRTLAAVRQEAIRKMPAAVSRKFLQPARLAWDDFATPRELLEGLAADGSFEILGLEQIPHDLWAAADLPAMSLSDRLTLILVQFDRTFQVSRDGRQIRLVPVPADVALVRDYPGGTQPSVTAKNFATLAPDAQIKLVGNKVYVKGLLEDHERITAPRRRTPRITRPPTARDFANKRFTLTVQEQPLGVLLEQLAANLKLELHIDRPGLQQAGISLDQRISFRVEKVTIDELFFEVIKPTRLRYSRRNTVIEISPATGAPE